MMERAVIKDAVNFLRSVSSSYPGGVPKSIQPSVPKAPPSRVNEVRALFLVEQGAVELAQWSGPEGELLRRAVEQGLKWKVEQVAAVQADAFEEIETRPSGLLVALGAGALKKLTLEPEPKRGDWGTYKGRRLLFTHSLSDVLASSATKKEFWNDLQSLLRG